MGDEQAAPKLDQAADDIRTDDVRSGSSAERPGQIGVADVADRAEGEAPFPADAPGVLSDDDDEPRRPASPSPSLGAEDQVTVGIEESPGRVEVPSPVDDCLEELTLPSLIQPPTPLSPGSTLGPDGRLTVGEVLGTRGRVNRYSATWKAEADEKIAVELRESPVDQVSSRTEAEILQAVHYAMLPRAYLDLVQDDRHYLVLDRVDGETLDQRLRAGLPTEDAVSIVLQLAQVVRRLHQAGWALLGLTPADVVLGQPLRVIRLGHAARIGEAPSQALQVPGYSAPELAYYADPAALATVTGAEDVYTLGAILYEALAGHALPERGLDLGDLPTTIRVPGIPQLLAEVLTPPDERIELEAFYRRLLALKASLDARIVALAVASATTLGLNPTRQVNEDACGYAVWSVAGAAGPTEYALLCVADGMGGMEAGEVASRTAVSTVMQGAVRALTTVPEDLAGGSASGHHGVSIQASTTATAVLDPRALVRKAATAVHAGAQGRELGTTITCVVIQDGVLSLAHVGDTRAYLLRDGVLTQLTADHSLVAAMVASGVISAEEAHGHPDSNKVLRSLGSQRELPAAYVDDLAAAYGQPTLALDPDDWLMVCSDGVWGQVEDADIRVILMEALDPSVAAKRLIDRALEAGAPDNATAIVARCVRNAVLP